MSTAAKVDAGPHGRVGGSDPLCRWGTATNTSGEVTPHDSNAQPTLPARGLWVGTAGTIVLEDHRGYQCVLENFSGWFPGYVSRVRAAEAGGVRTTTASNIVAFQ